MVENDLFEDVDSPDPVGLSCALEAFSESEEVITMIDELPLIQIIDLDRAAEKARERFQFIFNQYLDQPHLLDPFLEKFLLHIVKLIRNTEYTLEIKHRAFKYLFIITNVRGYKSIVQHLPHEVEDLEPVLQLIEEQDPADTETWQTRYGLVLWLSIIVMLPFNMNRFNSSSHSPSMLKRLLDTCQTYLMCSDACRKVAAFLTARFLTRTDVKEVYLTPFIDWSLEIINGEISRNDSWDKFGPLAGLAAVLKHGERGDLLPHASRILKCIISTKCCEDFSLTSKYSTKIVTRIGLIFLKPKVPKWRYSRGQRSLAFNLVKGNSSFSQGKENNSTVCLDEEDEDDEEAIPQEVEEVIEELVQALQNRNSTTRLSASKGIGRVVSRLSKTSGDEVVCYILDLLNPRSSDNSWHGGCLALAELAKRGLLLPSRLSDVMPLVIKALVYEEPHGYSSVGENVRDAASYVCWAFARAYEPIIIEPYCAIMAKTLLAVACFDREIHCRRAAAAAFQENVGRLGNFPHGIEILTTADYFTIGSRSNAFLEVSVQIAQYEEYAESLINHLLQHKIDNWDSNIRILASKALSRLTARAPQHMASHGLSVLFEHTKSSNINAVHGAVLAIGEVVFSLSLIPEINLEPHLDRLEKLVAQFREKNQLKGILGELLMTACCSFIDHCSQARLPFHGKPVIDEWQHLINECVCNPILDMSRAAAFALKNLSTEYYKDDSEEMRAKCIGIVEHYTQFLDVDESSRTGCVLALGYMPGFMLESSVTMVVRKLIKCISVTQETIKWAPARSGAIKALVAVCHTMGLSNVDKNKSCYGLVVEIINAFLEGMKDYSITNRGDIGALVREAAMQGFQSLLIQTTDEAIELLTPDLVSKIIMSVVQQAVERIDRTRGIAGKVFSTLLHKEDTPIPHFPAETQVRKIFTKEVCATCHWTNASETFPLFNLLLTIPEYTKTIMLGLITSIGGITETLANEASEPMFNHITIQSEEEKKRIAYIIVEIFEEYQDEERIAVPFLTFLERYITSGCLKPVFQDPHTYAAKILKCTKASVAKTTNSRKLTGSIAIYCQLLKAGGGGEVTRRSFVQLGIYLCHRFMWLRRQTSNALYETLMSAKIFGEECGVKPEIQDEVLAIVGETMWDELSIEAAREKRNAFFKLLDITPPRSILGRNND